MGRLSRAGRVPVNELAELVGPFWSAERVRAALDLPGTTSLEKLAGKGDLLSVTTADGVAVYPVSQFQLRGESVRVIPAVRELLQLLRDVDPWTKAVMLSAPHPLLEGRSPIAWARDRGVDSTLERLARCLASDLAQ